MVKWQEYIEAEYIEKLRDRIVLEKKKNKIRYFNISVSFDTETTSFYTTTKNKSKVEKVKRACMYIWAMNIDGISVYGRTWEEFRNFLFTIKQKLGLNHFLRMIIYVHNLAFDFQFMIGQVKINSVFARKKRHPIKALVEDCFEFKCSYILSGLSLANVAKNLKTPIRKMVGDLDYSKIRHSKTPLSEKEMNYVDYDVKIVYLFIKEEMEKNNNDISQIPLTKTGYVRKYCREYIRSHTNWNSYRQMIKREGATDPDLFILLNKSFAGGYTHANYMYIDQTLNNVDCIDFASSYPAVMVCEKYPRGKFFKTSITNKEQFYKLVDRYACVFEIKLKNIQSKSVHHVWSKNKCVVISPDSIIDNGRIDSANEIMTYMTDIDFKIFDMYYTFEIEQIGLFYWAKYDYLPKPIIECVLKYYGDKTTLKGVADMIAEYFVAKGMVNGIYGMMVTNPLNDEIIFDEEEWTKSTPNMETSLLNTYQNNPNTFLSYQWGVWITAHARYNLLSQLYLIGEDAVYCDTDSIKMLHYNKHLETIKEYNNNVIEKMKKVCEYYSLDFGLTQPEKDGVKYPLGVWSFDGHYEQFKTLGAKRYCYSTYKDNKWDFHITVSGIPNVTEEEYEDENGEIKKRRMIYCPTAYIASHGDFDFFSDDMEIPATYSRRIVHSYGDDEYTCNLKDYLGNECVVSEKHYVHLEKSKYRMGLSEEFSRFLYSEEDSELFKCRFKRRELAITPFQVYTVLV